MNQKAKLPYLVVIILSLAFGFASLVAIAKNDNANAQSQGNQAGNAVQTEEQNKVMNQGEDIQIQTQEQNTVQTKDKVKDKTKENKSRVTAEEHRSTVASFVQSLLSVADREGGIGQQVRVIAQQQNETKEKVAESIDKVESRGKIKIFLVGADYKNIGALRSEMVKTRNQIEQLKRLAEKAENEGDKTELQNQIQALEQEQTNIDNFITQNESKFSLFGWVVKLLGK